MVDPGRPTSSNAQREIAIELALFLTASILLYALAVGLDLFGRLMALARGTQASAVGAWFTLAFVLAVAFAVFATRRWVDLGAEVQRRRAAEIEALSSAGQLRQLTENIRSVTWLATADRSRLLYVSPVYGSLYGRPVETLEDDPQRLLDAVHPQDLARVERAHAEHRGRELDIEYRIVRPDGEVLWLRERTYPITDPEGHIVRVTGIATDVTARKEAEHALENERRLLADVVAAQEAVAKADMALDGVLDELVVRTQHLTGADGVGIELAQGDALVYRAGVGSAGDEVGRSRTLSGSLSGHAYSEGELLVSDETRGDGRVDAEACERTGTRSIVVAPLCYHGETFGVIKLLGTRPSAFGEREVHTVRLMAGFIAGSVAHAMAYDDQRALLTELTAAVNRVRRTNAFLRLLQSVAVAANANTDPADVIAPALESACGYMGWNVGHAWIVSEDGERLEPSSIWWHDQPARYRSLARITSELTLEPGEDLPGRAWASGEPAWVRDLAESDLPRGARVGDLGVHGALAVPVKAQDRVVGVLEFFHVKPQDRDDSLAGLLGHVADQVARVFERRDARRELTAYAKELRRSNRELEDFAYVASHDLQEPLRMITNYLQLLERRRGAELGEDGKEFMHYAVDGAVRMRQLIDDLLLYSRVGTQGKEFVRVPMGRAVEAALTNLQVAIASGDAEVVIDELPEVHADPDQLVQLFQNLIGNAIKFRGDEPPRVKVSAEREDGEWVFSVADNGIGIGPEHADRVFTIFQRLHTRERYEGTGIGLAVCKRIAERHGGQIWVESEEGAGATFCFTLPGRQLAVEAPVQVSLAEDV